MKIKYTDELIERCTPIFKQGLRYIYSLAKQKTDLKKLMLRNFQDKLQAIPKWNSMIIMKEFDRFKINSNCLWLDKLIKASFVAEFKHSNNGKHIDSQIKLDIPKSQDFIHICYIEIARALWSKPQLLYDGYQNDIRKYNEDELSVIIREKITKVIKDMLPLEQMISSFLKIEEEIYNSDDDEKTSVHGGVGASGYRDKYSKDTKDIDDFDDFDENDDSDDNDDNDGNSFDSNSDINSEDGGGTADFQSDLDHDEATIDRIDRIDAEKMTETEFDRYTGFMRDAEVHKNGKNGEETIVSKEFPAESELQVNISEGPTADAEADREADREADAEAEQGPLDKEEVEEEVNVTIEHDAVDNDSDQMTAIQETEQTNHAAQTTYEVDVDANDDTEVNSHVTNLANGTMMIEKDLSINSSYNDGHISDGGDNKDRAHSRSEDIVIETNDTSEVYEANEGFRHDSSEVENLGNLDDTAGMILETPSKSKSEVKIIETDDIKKKHANGKKIKNILGSSISAKDIQNKQHELRKMLLKQSIRKIHQDQHPHIKKQKITESKS